jgi:hypothetical protein
MRLLDRLERWIRPIAISNLTILLIAGQVVLFAAQMARPDIGEAAIFSPSQVLHGEVWRFITFLLLPPTTNPFWALLFWYVFYLFGSTLENSWGEARYNLYLLLGYLATVGSSLTLTLITGQDAPAGNAFLEGTVFLAFAYLYPNFELLVFFILPVKVKWLALLAWIGYAVAFINGPMIIRVLVAASIANFFLFFGGDIIYRMRMGGRRMAWQARMQSAAHQRGPRHRCAVCGIDSETHPQMDFRYCTKCAGNHAYCSEHLATHQHVQEE